LISWIVATHDPTILMKNLVTSLWILDDLVVVENPPNIAAAYNEGQRRAIHPLRVYVHHDVQVLDLPRLRAELLEHVTPERGMVGLIGSRTDRLPWWDGDLLGSVFDQRIGFLDNGPGRECAQLDGVLLATVHDVTWDESIPGFHGYDYDVCRQMADRGLPNFCLDNGKELLRHNTTSGRDPDHLTGWAEALSRLREKWGGQDRLG
jgi:hypothetical protein